MKLSVKIIIIILSFLFAQISLAAQHMDGIGGFAESLMDPVGLFSQFMFAGCISIGGSFVFASIVKYVEHRRSPLMVPISTVVFLFVAGCALLAMPFFSYVYTHAVGFSITK